MPRPGSPDPDSPVLPETRGEPEEEVLARGDRLSLPAAVQAVREVLQQGSDTGELARIQGLPEALETIRQSLGQIALDPPNTPDPIPRIQPHDPALDLQRSPSPSPRVTQPGQGYRSSSSSQRGSQRDTTFPGNRGPRLSPSEEVTNAR